MLWKILLNGRELNYSGAKVFYDKQFGNWAMFTMLAMFEKRPIDRCDGQYDIKMISVQASRLIMVGERMQTTKKLTLTHD